MRFFLYFFFTWILGLLFIGCGKDQKNADAGKNAPKPVITVQAILVQPDTLSEALNLTGNLMANEETEIRAEVSGRLVRLNFQEGSFVKQGQLLAKIDDAELRAELKKLKVRQNIAKADEARKKKLLAIKAVSREEYELSTESIHALVAEQEGIIARISRTEIYAPFSGKIGLRKVSQGAYVTPSNLIATLQNLNPIKLEFQVPERHANLLKEGMNVQFTIEGKKNPYTGNLYAIEPKIDPETRTLKVRAQIPNPNGELIPGAFAKVNFPLQKFDNALLAPIESVIPDLKGQKVYIQKGGKAVATKVQTGIRTPNRIQITEGVKVGDTLLTTGIMQLKDGMHVKVKLVPKLTD